MIAFVTSADRSRAKKKQARSRKDQKERKVKVWHMRARGFIRTPLICDLRGSFYAAIWWNVRLLIMTHFLQRSFALISCEWSNKWSQCCATILRMKNCKPRNVWRHRKYFIVSISLSLWRFEAVGDEWNFSKNLHVCRLHIWNILRADEGIKLIAVFKSMPMGRKLLERGRICHPVAMILLGLSSFRWPSSNSSSFV